MESSASAETMEIGRSGAGTRGPGLVEGGLAPPQPRISNAVIPSGVRNDRLARSPFDTPRSATDPDRLDVHELADPERAQLPAVARLLHPAERHPWIRGDHGVHEDHACLQLRHEAGPL